MAKLGADPEQLDDLADRLNSEAKRIEAATAAINRSLARVYWRGPHADDFRRRWATVHRPMANMAVEALHGMGRTVKSNASEQRRASGEGGTFAAGAPVGGGRGGGSSGGGSKPIRTQAGIGVEHTAVDAERYHATKVAGYEKDENGRWVKKEAPDPNAPKDPTKVSTSAAIEKELASDHREATAGYKREGSTSYDGVVQADAQGRVIAGAHAENDASIKVSNGNLVAESSGSAMVGVKAEGSASVGKGPVEYGASGNAMVGGEVSYGAKGQIGLSGVGADVNAGAFVGGKIEGTVYQDVAGIRTGVGGGVSYGVGAEGSAKAMISTREIGVKADLHLSLGVGLKLKIDVSVDPVEFGSNVWDGAKGVGGAAKEGVKDVAGAVGKGGSAVKNFTGKASPWW